MTRFTIAYATPDEAAAQRLAAALDEAGHELGEVAPGGVLVAVVSPGTADDPDLKAAVDNARALGASIVVAQLAPADLPLHFNGVPVVTVPGGKPTGRVVSALTKLDTSGQSLGARNLRWGIGIGLGLLVLFGFYTWAIAVFDIEAPAEDFERARTRIAATVNAIAQPFIPQSTEQAEAFETTLQSREISDELATVVIGTATQAAADGGFTPMPTGMIVLPNELSEVRQTATGSAIIRATQAAAGEDAEFEAIAATATQAAAEANADLETQLMTVTAAAQQD